MPDDGKTIGRYEVTAEIGRGSQGIVHRAHDPITQRDLAIKTILFPHWVSAEDREEFHARFNREVEAAQQLSHPGIVSIHEFEDQPEDGTPYVVMEYVPGPTLHELIRQEGALKPEWALDAADTLADALQLARDNGVAHPDLKPANILVRETDGVAKIADFGVAHLDPSDGAEVPAVPGSPAYLAPERVRGWPGDIRSDLFSLALILYEMLCGKTPFEGDTAEQVRESILYDFHVSITQQAEDLSPAFNAFFAKALAKEPEERFQNADEFRAALQTVGREQKSFAAAGGGTSETGLAAGTDDGGESVGATGFDDVAESDVAEPDSDTEFGLVTLPESDTGFDVVVTNDEPMATAFETAASPEPVPQSDPVEDVETLKEPDLVDEYAQGPPGWGPKESVRPAAGAVTVWLWTTAAVVLLVLMGFAAFWALRTTHSMKEAPPAPPEVASPATEVPSFNVRFGTPEELPPVEVDSKWEPEPVATDPAPEPPKKAPVVAAKKKPVKKPAAKVAAPAPKVEAAVEEPAPAVNAVPETPPEVVVPPPIEMARLALFVKSGVKDGGLTLLLDGESVYGATLSSDAKGIARIAKKAVSKGKQEMETEIEIPAGTHTLTAQFYKPARDRVYEETAEFEIEPGATRNVHIVVGKTFGSKLKLEVE